jgi:hypothetical protein
MPIISNEEARRERIREKVKPWCDLAALVLIAGAIIALICWGLWYRADTQRAVYARQGCKMTTWEILMGAKPIERNFVNQPEAKP